MHATTLVTGANGFVGRAVMARLGNRARGVTRKDVGPISADTDWSAAVTGMESVIHCAARAHVMRDHVGDPLSEFRRINRDGTLALAHAAKLAGVKRLVFVSSIGVNGTKTCGRAFRADDPPNPQSDYAVAKWEAEQLLAKVAIESVIVRAPLVIGAGAKGNIGSIAQMLRRGVPLPFGALTHNRRDLVSIDVLVDLLVKCIDHPAAAGHTFLVSDGRVRSTAAIVRAVAAAEGVPARLFPVSAVLLRLGLGVLGKGAMREQLLGDLEVDIEPTRRRLAWEPQPPGL